MFIKCPVDLSFKMKNPGYSQQVRPARIVRQISRRPHGRSENSNDFRPVSGPPVSGRKLLRDTKHRDLVTSLACRGSGPLTAVGRNVCSARTRSADANGRPSGRRASASATSAVNVSWWLAAICFSAAQNSASSATLVRRPAKEMVRLISVPGHLLLAT